MVLAADFEQYMWDCIQKCREFNYNPAYWKRMIIDHGAVDASHRLLAGTRASDGFTRLWEEDCLELSVEFSVLLPKYHDLFTDDERAEARRRLDGQSGGSERPYSWGMSQGGLALLLRLNKSWRDGISAEDLYEITRAWWVISPANAQRVERVLAVAGGVVREVYQPTRWLPSPVEGLENRIGFDGVVAPDRENYVGRDVSRLFRRGSANPVRYLLLDALLEQAVITPDPVPKTPSARAEEIPSGAVEPGLLERILPLLDAFEKDLLWAQSRAGQELFHSNTIAWLLRNFPIPCAPLLDLLGATRYDGVGRVDVWRERRHLDIVIDPVGASPKVVIENKLYSVPYPAQLTQYNAYSLPWSADHGDGGARATRYVLLSLMAPSFPLPAPGRMSTTVT